MQRELAKVLWNFLLLALGIITTGILVTNLLAGRIITPLRNLAAGARKVGEGDLSTVVVPTTQDEVGQLTALFNLMTKSLQERNEAISSNLATIKLQIAQLTTLNQSGAAITSTLDLDRLLSTVLQILSENLGFARMVLFLWDSERGIATVGQILGMPPEAEEAVRQLAIPVGDDGGIAAELLIHGKPVLASNLDVIADRISPAVLPVLRQVGIFSFVGRASPQPATDSRILRGRPWSHALQPGRPGSVDDHCQPRGGGGGQCARVHRTGHDDRTPRTARAGTDP